MDATCTIQDSIHVFNLVHKYVSRILGTYHTSAKHKAAIIIITFLFIAGLLIQSPYRTTCSVDFAQRYFIIISSSDGSPTDNPDGFSIYQYATDV